VYILLQCRYLTFYMDCYDHEKAVELGSAQTSGMPTASGRLRALIGDRSSFTCSLCPMDRSSEGT